MLGLIIDVGAGDRNLYSDLLRINPDIKIHAIEPHPILADDITAEFPGVIVHRVVITNGESGKTNFYLCNQHGCSSTLPLAVENVRRWRYPTGRNVFEMNEHIIVPSTTLTEFLREYIPQRVRVIDRLNIDTQGDALSVLLGLSDGDWKRIQTITVKAHTIDWELYRGQCRSADVVSLIESKGFTKTNGVIISRGQECRYTFTRDISAVDTPLITPRQVHVIIPQTTKLIGMAKRR